MHDAPASQGLFERAERVIPGGVNSPVRAFRAVGGTPRFMVSGKGPYLTDADGRYRFVTIKPGAYPWKNHPNAWRPAHLHFSLFGRAFCTRLVTQMYFPGDPLLQFDPMLLSIPDGRARERLVAAFDWDSTVADFALGYRFDIVLRGRNATPLEGPR